MSLVATVEGMAEQDADGPLAFEPLARSETLTERVYGTLREKIAAGQLPPGQRLSERRLAVLLGVSPTPVHDAMRRLEQEGLVYRSGPRTLRVAEHSERSLRELLYVRALLRGAEARFAAGRITERGLAAMREALNELESATAESAPEDVLAAGRRFDAEITAAADNERLQTMIESTTVIGPARRLQSVTAMATVARDIGEKHLQAHRDILAALTAGDADEAERQVVQHMLSAIDLQLAQLTEPERTEGTAR
ncbi:GntR family transcriptional regulator [Microbispora sp. GKU 823]|uniref:GntR family transcriptional regulator n=1 Tax=Microbispora sp. GKU 823 TaxID=1652100 RepID=UPI0009A2BDBD|nr:GntR family transcriptional regulator [Microbispora sp. GKU 823]OPG09464.1 hypothetical protein B1L11_26055 [Microbispora sp. GKU 823]